VDSVDVVGLMETSRRMVSLLVAGSFNFAEWGMYVTLTVLMDFKVAEAERKDVYNLLIGLVAPRPIAWITSMDLAGQMNAAPFSAFNYMGTEPPIVAIGIGNRPGPGVIVGKDTAQNIRNTREFVINVVNEDLAEAMNVTAVDFPAGVDELEVAFLRTEPSLVVKVPRIAAAPAALECREIATVEIGRSRVVLGEVVSFHVKDEFVDPAGPYILAEKLHAVGRMNGLGAYVRTREAFFHIERMNYKDWCLRTGKGGTGEEGK
jgi:flavin reductase (DIM6/NTAB) family NADH-FMN oxidoreductase RutF